MANYKDASQITRDVLLQLYCLQTQDDKVAFLLSLYRRLNEGERADFLSRITGRTEEKDLYIKNDN